MSDKEKGAKDPESLNGKEGAKQEETPPSKEVIAELKRKAEEFSTVKEQLSETQDLVKSLQEKLEASGALTPKEKKVLDQGVTDQKELVKIIKANAAKGDKDAIAWLAAIKEEAIDTANQIFEERWTKAELARDFEKQDELMEIACAEQKVDQKELYKLVNPYAKAYMNESPSRQFKLAYNEYKRVKDIDAREAKLKQDEDAAKNFRDGGSQQTGGLKTRDWSKTGEWRKA